MHPPGLGSLLRTTFHISTYKSLHTQNCINFKIQISMGRAMPPMFVTVDGGSRFDCNNGHFKNNKKPKT